MKAIVNTINSIDENSKKIVYKHFDQDNVNILAKEAPAIVSTLSKISDATNEKDVRHIFHSDGFESDSSGNRSEDDELCQIHKLKNVYNNRGNGTLSEVFSDHEQIIKGYNNKNTRN